MNFEIHVWCLSRVSINNDINLILILDTLTSEVILRVHVNVFSPSPLSLPSTLYSYIYIVFDLHRTKI